MNLAAVFRQFLHVAPAQWRRKPLRQLLCLFSIAAAVTLFVSMRITQESLKSAFNGSLRNLAGGTQYVVRGPHGLATDALAAVESVPGVRAAPLVQGAVVLTQTKQTVMVIGVDPLRDARLRNYRAESRATIDLPALFGAENAAVAPRRLATRHGWKTRDRLRIAGPRGPGELTLVGILDDEGPAAAMGGQVLFMPLAAAQRLLDRGDRFDRIDLALDPPATLDAVRKSLPPGVLAEPFVINDPTFGNLLAQFMTVLVTITVFSSLIGAFIVFNAVSLSVVERAREIGTLRSLGAQRGELLCVFVLEAAAIGLLGSTLGLLGGALAARLAVAQVSTSINIVIPVGEVTAAIPTDVWWLAPLVGLATAVIGAISPARTAVRMPPVAVLKSGTLEQSVSRRAMGLFLLSLPLLAAGVALVQHPRTSYQWTVGGMVVGMIAVTLAGPQIVAWLGSPLRRAGQRCLGVPGALALDNLSQFPSRTSLTTVAFGGSLALVVAVAGTIAALDRSVTTWMDELFVFDLSAQMNDLQGTAYAAGTFPPALFDEARADPECLDAYGVRLRLLPFRDDEIMLIAYDVEPFQRGRIERGLSRDPAEDLRTTAALRRGDVMLSDNFSRLHGVGVGERIALDTPSGRRSFEVAGLYNDHSWFRGVVMMDLAAYRRVWKDDALNYLDIRVRPGHDIEAYRSKLTQRWADSYGLFVHRADHIKGFGRAFVKQWFALANVQLLLAVVIGGVGVANTLMISVLTQSRQIALLRAIGASPAQVRRMLLTEAGFLGLLGAAVGCGMGMITVRFLVVPMALKAAGEWLPLVIPWTTMLLAVGAGLGIALAAALLPLRAAGRLDVVRAIGYE